MKSPKDGATLPAGQKVPFSFALENYELKNQTDAPPREALANSAEGQHLHVILNNAPYMAKYDEAFELDLEPGRYLMLTFLSRSYHESVKNPEAYTVSQFVVGEPYGEPYDAKAAHLFYSRPKGSYTAAEAKNLLLDFYLLNTNLSEDGNKVRATVNGQTFLLNEWAPYIIQGLMPGEVTIKLELMNSEGAPIPGPFNSVERTITITEA
ncbi:MAG: phosphopeptide-binding protein [Myxococcales bacterium]|nr:phosphopeptide-binding protein [Myxococcales bacterium]